MDSFGHNLRLTTFGESHGPAIGGVLEGCPTGISLDLDFIASELTRRRLGDIPSAQTTARQEPDPIEWLSGIYLGHTLGTPIAFAIRNSDCRSADYEALRDCYRPGHADYTYQQRYGYRDHRGGGRASGRETVARVVAGAIAKQLLRPHGIAIQAQVEEGRIRCTLNGVPAGIGNPVFDRLNARLSYAMFSIPSCASFTMGDTPDSWQLQDFADAWVPYGQGPTLTATNHCGGIQGGISNGMPIVFYVGFHRPITRPEGMECRRADGSLVTVQPHGRHDANHIQRLPVIVESMAALTLADFIPLKSNHPEPQNPTNPSL